MEIKFYKKILKNGITLLFEKRDLPLVSIGFGVKSGGINESLNEKGISHFIEHLLFKGTKNRTAKQISFEIEKIGGILNGFTDESITCFLCKLPSEHLSVGLNVLSDVIKNPLFEEKEIEKERQVIFEEIKMRKDMPQIYALDKIKSCLYEGNLGSNLIGDFKTMNSLNKEKIIKRFKETFVSENIILCVVGNADFNKVVDFAEKNFELARPLIKTYKNNLKNESKEEFRLGLDQSHIVFAYHTPLAQDKKSHSAYLLNTMMAEGLSSRLFNEIREKRNLAYAIKGGSDINKDYAFNYIYVGTTFENVEEVKKIILKEFEDVSKNLNEKELEEVKKQIIGNYYLSFEDSQGQMIDLMLSEINDSAENYYLFDKNIKAVSLRDIKEIAKKVVQKHSFFVLNPQK